MDYVHICICICLCIGIGICIHVHICVYGLDWGPCKGSFRGSIKDLSRGFYNESWGIVLLNHIKEP